jgi:hypothetical protein
MRFESRAYSLADAEYLGRDEVDHDNSAVSKAVERMIQALIFDFDGLILDTETPCFRSWQEVFREHGCGLSVEDWAALIDRSLGPADLVACLEQCLGYPVDRRAIHARRIQRELKLLVAERPLPGVEQILAQLPGTTIEKLKQSDLADLLEVLPRNLSMFLDEVQACDRP